MSHISQVLYLVVIKTANGNAVHGGMKNSWGTGSITPTRRPTGTPDCLPVSAHAPYNHRFGSQPPAGDVYSLPAWRYYEHRNSPTWLLTPTTTMGNTPAREFVPVRIAVMTVSDSRTEASDTSGKALVERLTQAGHLLAEKCMVPDNIYKLREVVSRWIADAEIHVIISTGGTGLNGTCFVTFLLFARPSLQRLQGRMQTSPRCWPVSSGFDHRSSTRREYLRVRVSGDPLNGLIAEKFPRQGSDVLSSVAWADGLVEIAENTDVHPGDRLRYLPFSEWAS